MTVRSTLATNRAIPESCASAVLAVLAVRSPRFTSASRLSIPIPSKLIEPMLTVWHARRGRLVG